MEEVKKIYPLWITKRANEEDIKERLRYLYTGIWFLTEYLGMDEMVSVGDTVEIYVFDQELQNYYPTGIKATIIQLDDCFGNRFIRSLMGWKYLVQFKEEIPDIINTETLTIK